MTYLVVAMWLVVAANAATAACWAVVACKADRSDVRQGSAGAALLGLSTVIALLWAMVTIARGG